MNGVNADWTPPPLRCVSLWEPWASLCVFGSLSQRGLHGGYKRYETRPDTITWHRYRGGDVAIQAAKNRTALKDGTIHRIWEEAHPGRPLPPELAPERLEERLGHVVGLVRFEESYTIMSHHVPHRDLEGNHLFVACPPGGKRTIIEIPADQYPLGGFGPGRTVIALSNARALKRPLAARGMQGLWTLDGATTLEVLSRL